MEVSTLADTSRRRGYRLIERVEDLAAKGNNSIYHNLRKSKKLLNFVFI
jgi:hypothetical protein